MIKCINHDHSNRLIAMHVGCYYFTIAIIQLQRFRETIRTTFCCYYLRVHVRTICTDLFMQPPGKRLPSQFDTQRVDNNNNNNNTSTVTIVHFMQH